MRRCTPRCRAYCPLGPISGCIALILLCAAAFTVRAQTSRLAVRDVLPSVLTLETFGADGVLLSRASAFFVSRNVVATNFHALEGARSAFAHTFDGAFNFPVAGAVALDPQSDLALLELEAADRNPLHIAASDSFEIGEEVFVFGSPKGLDGSVTKGIVSGASLRRVANMELLQISAPISPGNSGGPVLNARGEVIGVATLTVDDGRNLNFAVPASKLRKLIAKIGSGVIPIASIGARADASRANAARAEVVSREPACCGDSPLTVPSGRDVGFYVREAERLYDERRYEAAKEAYKRAIDLDPRNAWSYFALGHLYLKLGCGTRAVVAARQAVILKPKETRYRDGLGWVLLKLGRYDEAAEIYEEVVEKEPKLTIARTRLGVCYYSMERISEATVAFKEALRVDGKCALARFWLGKTYAEKLGDMKAALDEYRILQTQDAALAEEMAKIVRSARK